MWGLGGNDSAVLLKMNRLSLRNNQFKTAGKLPIVLEEFVGYTPISKRKTGGFQYVTG
jgi:hypothetical protein